MHIGKQLLYSTNLYGLGACDSDAHREKVGCVCRILDGALVEDDVTEVEGAAVGVWAGLADIFTRPRQR